MLGRCYPHAVHPKLQQLARTLRLRRLLFRPLLLALASAFCCFCSVFSFMFFCRCCPFSVSLDLPCPCLQNQHPHQLHVYQNDCHLMQLALQFPSPIIRGTWSSTSCDRRSFHPPTSFEGGEAPKAPSYPPRKSYWATNNLLPTNNHHLSSPA